MEFDWSAADRAFAAEVDDALALLPPGWDVDHRQIGEDGHNEFARTYVAELAARGLLTPHWPLEAGGRGASAWQHLILGEAMWAHNEPRGSQYMNVNWIGPTILAVGSPEQRAYHLPRIARGDVRWCQGFSEPEAGSDLASLKTRADRDGEEFVINGQKIWTSYANVAEFCFLLARTSHDEDRHRGVSILIVPMSAPGVEVREIRALVHEHAFHEVFFSDVRVPATALLGPEGAAWQIIRETLAYERVGSPRYARAALLLDLVAGWAEDHDLIDDAEVRSMLGRARAACEAARLLTMWVIDERAKARRPSDRAYVARVAMVRAERVVAEVAMAVMGQESVALDSLADMQHRGALAAGIAAGSYEIQLNLVARHCLGLTGA